MSKEKVVLAYSGGLDTTAIIPWLKETFNYDVICCCIDCGQGEELDGLDERAKLSGASKLYIENIIDEFCDDFIVPCVKAGAVYENKYLLGTSMARPAIAKKLVEIARKEGAVAICHGATGKGNDQIRFELGIKALAPDIKIIAPWRMTDVWTMQSREDEIDYCKAHGIDLPFDAKHSYSRDRNLWHISHEGLELENPANEPNYDDLLVLSTTPEKAPDKDEYVTMTFEAGVPKSVNGKEMKVSEIITELNRLGGKHGIGIVDIVENRVVGMKSRGVYETPGGTILMEAHDQLEELVLDRATYEVKKDLGNKFAQIVYEGKWYTPLREAIQAFVDVTQQYVTGEVKFSHVNFGYNPNQTIINDFSVDVKPGQKIAIVGPTGAGKTTMVKLLMRFYDVNGGQILLDNHDVRDYNRRDLRKAFGMVLQDTWLYKGTIMENIRYGRLDATDEEVIEAAKAAHADSFIRTLPGGYNMELNEDASNVSQGQKQLLTIARAILADSKVMILDEATSSVDTRTEALIQKAMDNLMEGRTSFVIAHRLSTIKNADVILVMKDGDIIEQGNHEELLAKGGFYAQLYNSQFEEAA